MTNQQLAEAVIDALEPHLSRNYNQYRDSENQELRAAAVHFQNVRTKHVGLVLELLNRRDAAAPVPFVRTDTKTIS